MSVFSWVKSLVRRVFYLRTQYHGDPGRASQETVELFRENPDNTFLVSFPRTGSHWLRMMIELYFERPLLVRSFFYFNRENYLLLHVHDLKLSERRRNVLYLHRNPVDTIYSMIQHQKENIRDLERISYWSDLYGRHLDKWLHQEDFTENKTVVTYESLKYNLVSEFAKVTRHFGQTLDKTRLMQVASEVTKKKVKKKTSKIPRIIQLDPNYEQERQFFREHYSKYVWDSLTKLRPHLIDDFNLVSTEKRGFE